MFSIILGLVLAAGAEPTSEQPEMAVANSWVQLVDKQRWDDSWTAAGTLFKTQMPQTRWASTIASVRVPLGPVSSRVVRAVTKPKSLPGAPDGDYEVVQFDTSFANKAVSTETVVLSREATGWKVDGYFIR